MLEDVNKDTVNKLRNIVQSRYGKGMEIRQICEANFAEKNEFAIRGVDLHIPLTIEDNLLGTAVVPDAKDLSIENQKTLSQMIKMVLEPVMYSSFLERKEDNLKQTQLFSESTIRLEEDNVNFDLQENEDIGQDYNEFDIEVSDDNELISNLCNLEGENPENLKRVALHIHEMTHRWAFVPWSDMKSQIKTVECLINLGSMTIYIDQIESLSAQEQQIIIDYLSEIRSFEQPLLVTSCRSIDALDKSKILPYLVDEIEVSSFKIDNAPLDILSLREVLDLFFFKGKNNPLS